MALRKATQAQVDRARKTAARKQWEAIVSEMKREKGQARDPGKRALWQVSIMEARMQADKGVLPGSGKWGGIKVPTAKG